MNKVSIVIYKRYHQWFLSKWYHKCCVLLSFCNLCVRYCIVLLLRDVSLLCLNVQR